MNRCFDACFLQLCEMMFFSRGAKETCSWRNTSTLWTCCQGVNILENSSGLNYWLSEKNTGLDWIILDLVVEYIDHVQWAKYAQSITNLQLDGPWTQQTFSWMDKRNHACPQPGLDFQGCFQGESGLFSVFSGRKLDFLKCFLILHCTYNSCDMCNVKSFLLFFISGKRICDMSHVKYN